jgi:hypothetical protein
MLYFWTFNHKHKAITPLGRSHVEKVVYDNFIYIISQTIGDK